MTTSRLHTAFAFARTVAALVLALGASACAQLATVDPGILWKIVEMRCVPSEQATGTPGQCTSVNLDKRYAILKDILGRSQFLLIPTDRISGIESPRVLDADAAPYWADAWSERHVVEGAVRQTLAANQIGLEINSSYQRSQNQLHIHIDCMRTDIVEALAQHRADPVGQWRWDTLDGHRYRIMRVTALTQDSDPFRIVARDHEGTQAMAGQTILVTGAGPSADRDGWLIVNSGIAVEDGSGTAEPLLDHECRLAEQR